MNINGCEFVECARSPFVVLPISSGVTLIINHSSRFDLGYYRRQAALGKNYNDAPTNPFTTDFYTQASLEEFLRQAVRECAPGLAIAITPTYFRQYLGGCLLKRAGFKLANGLCFVNNNYPTKTDGAHPGCPDKLGHMLHIWYRIVGTPKVIRLPGPGTIYNWNCCGIYRTTFTGAPQSYKGPPELTTLAFVPSSTKLPDGWKRVGPRFDDYKLVHDGLLHGAKPCYHKFDLSEFDLEKGDYT